MGSTEQGRLPAPREAEGPAAAVKARPGASTRGTGGAETDGNERRETGPAASHLHASDSELSQGSAHLGGGCEVVFGVGDDLDQQGVIVGGDDSSLEGGSVIQADAHALTAPEHLWGGKGGLRSWVRSQSRRQPQPQLHRMHEGSQLWLAKFCFISAGAHGGKQGKSTGSEADLGTQIGAPNTA